MKEINRLIDQKSKYAEDTLILDQALCLKIKEKYIPFELEDNMPLELQNICGKLEGLFLLRQHRSKKICSFEGRHFFQMLSFYVFGENI